MACDIYSLVKAHTLLSGNRNAAGVVMHTMLINEKEEVNIKLIGGYLKWVGVLSQRS